MNNIKKKLNLGSGNDIKDGYVNIDFKQSQGVDVVHNLNKLPWPFVDKTFNEIIAENVVEHLDNFVLTMEEIHRISQSDALIKISVPYWNSSYAYIDPTHKRGFHEHTFSFFDPDSDYCKERSYYSTARFKIESFSFIIAPFAPYFTIPFVKKNRSKKYYFKKNSRYSRQPIF